MFMVTLNRKSLKKIGAAAACCLLAAAGAVGWQLSRRAEAAAAPVAKIESTQDIAAFFVGYGLEVDLTKANVDKVKVPKRWDDSFQAFEGLVAQSGLSLSACKGKTVEKWLVPIPARCDGTNTCYGVLLVYQSKAVGAYLLEKPSGEVTGLADAAAAGAGLFADGDGETDAEEASAEVTEPIPGADGYPVE